MTATFDERSIVLIEGKRRGRKSQAISNASTSTESQLSSSKLKEGPLSEVDEDYQREFKQLEEMFNVLNIDMSNEDEMWKFAKRWLTIFAPGIIAEMLIPIVKENVYVFGLKSGLTWSERAKLYLQSPPEKFTPEWYFKGVLRMLALVLKNLRKAFDDAMGENRQRQSGLNTLLKKEGTTEDETKKLEKELEKLKEMLKKLMTFHSIIQNAYAKCSQVTFKDRVCKELVESLIIKGIDQVRALLQAPNG